MCRNAAKPEPAEGKPSLTEGEFGALVNRLSCACTALDRHADAPLARAMFRRVETEGQRVEEATRALGIGCGDGTYLLAGLRRDVAAEIATALLAGAALDKEAPPRGAKS